VRPKEAICRPLISRPFAGHARTYSSRFEALGQWASPHVPRQALTARRWAPGEAASALVRELGADPGATSLAALCAGGAARPGAGWSTLALLGAQTQARRALSCQKRPLAGPQLAQPFLASFRPGRFMPALLAKRTHACQERQ
jgi:hypothetical protein